MINVEESEEGKWKTAYQDQSPFIDKNGTVWFQIDWFKKYLDTQKEWNMPSNQTYSFIEGTFEKNKLGGKDRKDDKRCFYIKKEYFEEPEDLEAKEMKEPETPY